MVGLSSGDLPSTLVDESACSATDGINILTLRKLLGDCWKLVEIRGIRSWRMEHVGSAPVFCSRWIDVSSLLFLIQGIDF